MKTSIILTDAPETVIVSVDDAYERAEKTRDFFVKLTDHAYDVGKGEGFVQGQREGVDPDSWSEMGEPWRPIEQVAEKGAGEVALADAVAERVVERLGATVSASSSSSSSSSSFACSPEPCAKGQNRVTEGAILEDVALMERVSRRLRRFVQGIVGRSVEIVPAPESLAAPIDDVTRAKARRALLRSGFIRMEP